MMGTGLLNPFDGIFSLIGTGVAGTVGAHAEGDEICNLNSE
jgi:hypothetical protein